MRNFERTLPHQLNQEIYIKTNQLDPGIQKLERAYSFNQCLENYTNYDQGNDNVRETNQKLFGNSQEISRIDGDHGSFQDECDQVTNPLSSMKRQTLFDNESAQISTNKVQNKIKSSAVSDFHVNQTDSSESLKSFMGILQSLSILNFSQTLFYSELQFVYEKNKNLRLIEQNIQISLEAQKHLINKIQSNQNVQISNDKTIQFKEYFSYNKNTGTKSKSKSLYFKEINKEIQHYVFFYNKQVYDIKLQTLQLKHYEQKSSEIPIINPILCQQQKRLLDEQKQKDAKKNQQQDHSFQQKLIEQKCNLDFTKLYQKVDESIIQINSNNLQTTFYNQNQIFQPNSNLFNNFINSNPFQNNYQNNQQLFVQPNTMSNNLSFTNNQSDYNKSKSYNTRSGRS